MSTRPSLRNWNSLRRKRRTRTTKNRRGKREHEEYDEIRAWSTSREGDIVTSESSPEEIMRSIEDSVERAVENRTLDNKDEKKILADPHADNFLKSIKEGRTENE